MQARAELTVLPMFVRDGAVIPLLPAGSLDATDVAHGTGVHWAIFLGNHASSGEGIKSGNGSRYFDAGDSTAHEGSEGAFATQALSYTLSSGGPAAAANQVVLKVAIAAAVANGRFVLPKTKVPHSIEVRGRRAPDTATMGGGAMKCSTISAKEQSLARPEGTVVCSGAAARGLGEPVEAVLQWE